MPVIGSKADGMEEVLPDEWLFPVNDGKEMMHCINHVFKNDQRDNLLKNHQYVLDNLNVHSFRQHFRESVLQCLINQRQA